MDPDLFFSAFIYLLAAAIAAPLGRFFGIGAVLGYLVIGAVIGPSALSLLGQDQEGVLHFAEFGVVLMLFVIGLELNLNKLWRMRASIFGLGGLQLLSCAVVLGLASGLIANDWREAVAMGLILALSSTAIVMQTLKERGLMDTSSGQQSFAVLLFQDIAVIPIIAFLPVLAHRTATTGGKGDGHGEGHSAVAFFNHWVEQLPAFAQGFIILIALAFVVFLGRFLLTPWLRWVAKLQVPEALNAVTLTLVVGVALLMHAVGLSPALGTFLAGVMLASSPYRHELEGNIEPFKSLLLAVFFIAVGAGIDFQLIGEQPGTVLGFVLLLIGLKFVVMYGLARAFGMQFDQRLLFAVALAQGGEFAFVLAGFAVPQGVLGPDLAALLIASVALSMAISPLLLLGMQRWILPRFGTTESVERDSDVQNDHARVLLAGFGRFGHPLGRLLRAAGYLPTVLEKDSDHIEFLRSIGIQSYYGDAARLELLHAAGADEAELIVIAIDDEAACDTIVEHCKKHFPHLKILARACSRDHAYRLHDHGVEYFVEQLGSSLDCAIKALDELGHDLAHAKDAARRFKEREISVISRLAEKRHDTPAYLEVAKQNLSELDDLLANAPLRLNPARKKTPPTQD